MPRQLTQGGAQVAGSLAGMRWVPTDHCEDIRKPFGEPDRSFAALQVGADADDPGNARRLRSRNNLCEFLGELWVIQMSVGVVEGNHARTWRVDCLFLGHGLIH